MEELTDLAASPILGEKQLKQKVEYIQTVIDFLDRTLKQISNRGFQIKNAIDWRKFTSGAI